MADLDNEALTAEEQIHEKRMQEAFNNGYLLSRYETDLAGKLVSQVNNDNEYYRIMTAGIKQHQQDRDAWAKHLLRNHPKPEGRLPQKEKDKENNKEKEK